MNSLIPWCPIKARNGSYEVVTREGHPVTEWHMFENIDPYPLRAVVEYPTGSKIVEFSRTGGYLDGDDEIAEDENDLMLKPGQTADVQAVFNKVMHIYLDTSIRSRHLTRSMCNSLIYAQKLRIIDAGECFDAELAVDEFMDHASRNQEDPDSFLVHVLAESGCENPAETALRIYQNWDQRMTILHEATDVKESV